MSPKAVRKIEETKTLSKGQFAAAEVTALLRARNPTLWIATREEARVDDGHPFVVALRLLRGLKPMIKGNTHADGSKPDKLSGKALIEFRKLVNGINSRGFDSAERVISRIKMTSFVAEHGKEACDRAFKGMNKR